jgi:hypothetical protein
MRNGVPQAPAVWGLMDSSGPGWEADREIGPSLFGG